MNTNTMTLVGRLTKDPYIKYTDSGTCILMCSVASTRPKKAGEEKDTADFINVKAWRGLAEDAGNTLVKGDEVVVIGRVQNNNYEKDGVKHFGTELVAEFIGKSVRAKKDASKSVSGDVFPDDDIPF